MKCINVILLEPLYFGHKRNNNNPLVQQQPVFSFPPLLHFHWMAVVVDGVSPPGGGSIVVGIGPDPIFN